MKIGIELYSLFLITLSMIFGIIAGIIAYKMYIRYHYGDIMKKAKEYPDLFKEVNYDELKERSKL